MNIHFGLGEVLQVDSVIIFWPGGSLQRIRNIDVNQEISIDYSNSTPDSILSVKDYLLPDMGKSYVQRDNDQYNIDYVHQEKVLFDFNYQRTLPHKFSQSTPGIAVGDINNDGLEDFYVGGSQLYPGTFFIQQLNNTFTQESRIIDEKEHVSQEMGVLFFDADQDNDLDLYQVSGGVLGQKDEEIYVDRLYFNDGQGYFSYRAGSLPDIRISGSCVKAADFDNDGDLDLFTGGRVMPGEYPYPVSSKLLINEGGVFQDGTNELCPDLHDMGLVSDALWTDFNDDQLIDLVVVGEWMPITFFKNTGKDLKNISKSIRLEPSTGWWNSIVGADIDNDGDTDYITGNIGLNTIYKGTEDAPLQIYASDFDKNGIMDPVIVALSSDEHFEPQPFPIHTRDDMIMQLSYIRSRIPTYQGYGKATVNDIFTSEELEAAYYKEGNNFRTVLIINEGKERFAIKELPIEAQFAPVFGILPSDINEDGNIDILMAGNDYSIEPMSGRIDAFNGLLMLGDGKGSFTVVKHRKSGFVVKGDAKGLVRLYDNNDNEMYLVSQNKDSLLVFSRQLENGVIKVSAQAQWAKISLKNGAVRKHEFHYGSSYLSQSSRSLSLSPEIAGIRIYDIKGEILEEKTFVNQK
jgi:hypothetical protein